MPKRLAVDHVAGTALAAFALAVLWETRKIPFGSLAEPGPGALPALLNAVNDALAPLGVRHLDMPVSPERVWQAIRGAGRVV